MIKQGQIYIERFHYLRSLDFNDFEDCQSVKV